MVHSYTREALGSCTLIDHIFSNDNNNLRSDVIKSCLSDHYAQSILINTNLPTDRSGAKFTYARSFNSTNIETFKHCLQLENWGDLYEAENIDSKFNAFNSTLSYHFDIAFPKELKSSIQKQKTNFIFS